jgi:hypothetical protein
MDQQYKRVGFDVRMVRLQPWKLWLLAAAGGAMALALAVAVAGLFLILVPLLVIGGLVVKLVLGAGSSSPTRAAGATGVIEGQYEVLDRPDGRLRGERPVSGPD